TDSLSSRINRGQGPGLAANQNLVDNAQRRWGTFVYGLKSVSAIQSVLASLPGHERRVDHVLYALAADRSDREVHVLEPEPVRRHQLQRKPLRGKLRERKLAGLVAVAAR